MVNKKILWLQIEKRKGKLQKMFHHQDLSRDPSQTSEVQREIRKILCNLQSLSINLRRICLIQWTKMWKVRERPENMLQPKIKLDKICTFIQLVVRQVQIVMRLDFLRLKITQEAPLSTICSLRQLFVRHRCNHCQDAKVSKKAKSVKLQATREEMLKRERKYRLKTPTTKPMPIKNKYRMKTGAVAVWQAW